MNIRTNKALVGILSGLLYLPYVYVTVMSFFVLYAEDEGTFTNPLGIRIAEISWIACNIPALFLSPIVWALLIVRLSLVKKEALAWSLLIVLYGAAFGSAQFFITPYP